MNDGTRGMVQDVVDSVEGILRGIFGVAGGLGQMALFLGLVLAALTVLWVLKLLLLLVLRRFGLLHPDHYHLIPRLPWRFAVPAITRVRKFVGDFSIGKKQTARWGGFFSVLTRMYEPGDLFIGRARLCNLPWLMPVGINPEKHVAMIAETGSGKTTSVISMLALHPGNAFVIDPKGQMAKVLRRRRGGGGDGVFGTGRTVHILDPNRMVMDSPTSCWNPFDELERVKEYEPVAGADAVVTWANMMAEGLVIQDSSHQPFFAEMSRSFVLALILHIHTKEPPERRNLITLRRYLTRGADPDAEPIGLSDQERLLMKMEVDAAYEAIPNAVGLFRNALARDKDVSNYLSSAIQQLKWIDNPLLQATLTRSDFTLGDLKNGDLTLFVCADVSDVREAYSGWFRMLTVMTIRVFEKDRQPPPTLPCLCVVDEMPSLGHCSAFRDAANIARSKGLRMVAITQNLELLKEAYPKSWEDFLGGASAVLWTGVKHTGSLEYLEKKLGGRTLKDGKDRPIAYAQQLETLLDDKRDIVVVTNLPRTLRLKTPKYYKELPVYLYDPDPDHKELPARAFTRSMIGLCQRAARRAALSAHFLVLRIRDFDKDWRRTLLIPFLVLVFHLTIKLPDSGFYINDFEVTWWTVSGAYLFKAFQIFIMLMVASGLLVGMLLLAGSVPWYLLALFVELSGNGMTKRDYIRRRQRQRQRNKQFRVERRVLSAERAWHYDHGGAWFVNAVVIVGWTVSVVLAASTAVLACDYNLANDNGWFTVVAGSVAAFIAALIFAIWVVGTFTRGTQIVFETLAVRVRLAEIQRFIEEDSEEDASPESVT